MLILTRADLERVLEGLDWERMAPGARLELGSGVQIEITRYTSPCFKIKPSFLGGDFSRVSQKRHPGWSRIYARVLSTGTGPICFAILRSRSAATLNVHPRTPRAAASLGPRLARNLAQYLSTGTIRQGDPIRLLGPA